MTVYLTHTLIQGFIEFQMIILAIVLTNIFILHYKSRLISPLSWPKVSILVPARNEEKNIANCIHSLLVQDYPDFELLVLDDQSIDNTLSILEKLKQESSRLTILTGKPVPSGWIGKNWACALLSQAACGDLMLFTDADTVFQPTAVRRIVTTLIAEDADLMTGYPKQVMKSWGERLLVPFFSWATFCFSPLGLAYLLPVPALAHAVGQMMCFRRNAYFAIGGHAGLKDSMIDDIQLARKIKAIGLRWRVMPASELITCRMYASSRAAFNGLAKNLFAVFDFRLIPYALAYLWLELLFWEPLVVLIFWISGNAPAARAAELGICIVLSLLLWVIASMELDLPLGLVFIYPINILAIGLAAFQSARLTMQKRVSWKERDLPVARWTWL